MLYSLLQMQITKGCCIHITCHNDMNSVALIQSLVEFPSSSFKNSPDLTKTPATAPPTFGKEHFDMNHNAHNRFQLHRTDNK